MSNENPTEEKLIKEKQAEGKFKFLDITAKLILIYLSLKLIVFPVISTGINITQSLVKQETIATDSFTIPELTFSDILLLIIIFLFQPEMSKLLKSLDLSPQGFRVKFRLNKLEGKVDETKQEIYNFQQEQIKEINKLQRFMYRLLLTPKEIEKLQVLKENSESNKPFIFYVTKDAASELRRLRDSELIKIKPPFLYVSDLEKASNHAKTDKDFINLTEYCEITKTGKEFLTQLKKLTDKKDLDISSIETDKTPE